MCKLKYTKQQKLPSEKNRYNSGRWGIHICVNVWTHSVYPSQSCFPVLLLIPHLFCNAEVVHYDRWVVAVLKLTTVHMPNCSSLSQNRNSRKLLQQYLFPFYNVVTAHCNFVAYNGAKIFGHGRSLVILVKFPFGNCQLYGHGM